MASSAPFEDRVLPKGRIIPARETGMLLDGQSFVAEAKKAAEDQQIQALAALEKARKEGFQRGEREARVRRAGLLAEAQRDLDRALDGIEGMVFGLVLDLVERVIGSINEPERVARAARRAVEDLRDANALRVSVAPGKAERVRALLAELPGVADLSVSEDERLPADACRIACSLGEVVADLPVQLEALRLALTEQKA